MPSPQQPENTRQPDGSGVGALLKASRLRIGEDLREVSEILCIRNVYLEAIEDGRYDDLPGPTYAIGFIRAYANHLGLDSDEIIRRFKDRASGEAPPSDLVFPKPISEAGIPGGAIIFVGALVAVMAYGVWYVNTSEDGFLAELISPVPDRLAKLVSEEAKPVKAEPVAEPAAPAEPEKAAEKEPEKAAEKEPEKAAGKEPEPQAPAETENKPAAEDSPEQQAAAWEPPPGVVKTPEPQSAPEPPAPQPAVPVEAASATPSVSAPVRVEESSPAAPEPQAIPAASTAPPPEPVTAPTVVPMDMIPPVPASSRPQTQAAAPVAPEPVAPEASAPEAAAGAPTETTPPAPAADEKKPVPETASAPAGDPAPGVGGAGRIVVRAKANSWIQVRDDAAGELVLTRMLKSGDSYIVPDRSGLILSTGNAGALEILVDGEPVPSVGGEGTVRRKIVLDAERLKSGTAVRE